MSLIPQLLHRRAFRNLWLGMTVSVFGDQITLLAIPIIAVLTLDAAPEQMGLLTAAGLLPHLLFSLPAGVWIDRVHRRRRLMVLADIARAVVILSIAVAFALNTLSLAQLYVVTFVVGTLAVGFDISWNTVYVKTVERAEYVSANSLLMGSRSLAQVAGPSIGGLLIQVLTAPIALVVDAVSFLLSAVFISRVDSPEAEVQPQTEPIRRRLATGLSFIARDSIMRPTLLSVATLNFFNFAFSALFVLYVTTFLGLNAGELGLALGAGAIGGVMGAVVAARFGRRVGIGRAFLFGMIVFPAAFVVVPLTPPGTPVWIAMAILVGMQFVAGFGVMVLDINASAIIPARTPDSIRSRVAGAWRFVNMGIRPIGALVGGLLGGAIGVRETLFATALLQLVGVLFLIRTPVLGLRDVPEEAVQ